MDIDQISSFYGDDRGWHMFDGFRLTPEIRAYLETEAAALLEIMHEGGYTRLIEIGCGYGRYLDAALANGFAYIGLDIVPWMIKLADLRCTTARVKYQKANCSVHLHQAERLGDLALLRDQILAPRTLAFFPFNCFGNLSSTDKVITALKQNNLACAISTFKIDASSTKSRKHYYELCGYKDLSTRLTKSGLIFDSQEGFHAMAYSQQYLDEMLERKGFAPLPHRDLPAGYLAHYKPINESKDYLRVEQQGWLQASACFILHDPLDEPQVEQEAGYQPGLPLLPMQELSGMVSAGPRHQLIFKSQTAIADGTNVRISAQASDIDQKSLAVDFVGHVLSTSSDDLGNHDSLVEINKSDRALVDLFFR